MIIHPGLSFFDHLHLPEKDWNFFAFPSWPSLDQRIFDDSFANSFASLLFDPLFNELQLSLAQPRMTGVEDALDISDASGDMAFHSEKHWYLVLRNNSHGLSISSIFIDIHLWSEPAFLRKLDLEISSHRDRLPSGLIILGWLLLDLAFIT
jgi:hypothetical protein